MNSAGGRCRGLCARSGACALTPVVILFRVQAADGSMNKGPGADKRVNSGAVSSSPGDREDKEEEEEADPCPMDVYEDSESQAEGFTVLRLGFVIWDVAGYHTVEHIYPLGYLGRRMLAGLEQPEEKVFLL